MNRPSISCLRVDCNGEYLATDRGDELDVFECSECDATLEVADSVGGEETDNSEDNNE